MKQILLVEDDPFLIEIYSQKLRKAKLGVRIAKDGEQALQLLEEETPDLLLLDIVLPEIEGWDVLKKIKEQSNYQKLKIIILSNLGQKEEVERGLNLGADKYLIKAQYTPTEVIEEVKKILKL